MKPPSPWQNQPRFSQTYAPIPPPLNNGAPHFYPSFEENTRRSQFHPGMNFRPRIRNFNNFQYAASPKLPIQTLHRNPFPTVIYETRSPEVHRFDNHMMRQQLPEMTPNTTDMFLRGEQCPRPNRFAVAFPSQNFASSIVQMTNTVETSGDPPLASSGNESADESGSCGQLAVNRLSGGVHGMRKKAIDPYKLYECEFREKPCDRDYFARVFVQMPGGPPRTPQNISEACSAYISFLLRENEERVQPLGHVGHYRSITWNELMGEAYFQEIMNSPTPTPMPTKKFNGFLQFFQLTTKENQKTGEVLESLLEFLNL